MAELTFRDFAGAVMKGDDDEAARVLVQLLALAPDVARAATAHFRAGMASDPAFMGQAMALRTAVAARDAAEIAKVLTACFALSDPTASVAALLSS